jgi:hypothetical protein
MARSVPAAVAGLLFYFYHLTPRVILLVFLLVSGEQTFTATFAIPNEESSRWPARTMARAPPPDVNCRAARPKFDRGAWSPTKVSDMTGGRHRKCRRIDVYDWPPEFKSRRANLR